PGAERTDRNVHGAAPLLALAKRIPFLFGEQLLRHIGVRSDPAAPAHRTANERDDASVLELDGSGIGAVLRRRAQAIGDIVIRIAIKILGSEAMHQQVAAPRCRTCKALGSYC